MSVHPKVVVGFLLLAVTRTATASLVHVEASMPRPSRPTLQTAYLIAEPIAAVTKRPIGNQPAEARQELSVPGHARLDLDPAWLWRLRVQGQGIWSREKTTRIDAAGNNFRFEVWPTGRIQGSVSVVGQTEKLREGVLSVRFQGSSGAIPEATLHCPIENAEWRCDLPAGELDLRLRVRGYISHFLWGRSIPTGGFTELGTLRLQAGSSVSGWVERPDGSATSPECEVRVLPQAGASSSLQDASRKSLLSNSARVNERGFFHLTAVPAGSYILEVMEPGFATARVFPIQVLERTEVQLQEVIVLDYPRRLEVRLEPPADPWGGSWRVELLQQTAIPGHETLVADPIRDADRGRWQWVGLAAGGYRVQVRGSAETAWHTEEVDLGSGDTSLVIGLDVLTVHGRVRLGEEGIAAKLWFGGRRGAQRVGMKADERGRFEGFLPRDGTWSVELINEEPPVHRFLESVEVKTRERADEASVEITLPDTVLRGRVVDEEGKPPAHSYLGVMSLGQMERPFFKKLGAEGKFELLGLAPGRILLLAQAPPDLSTNWVAVHAVEGQIPPEARLVVQAGVWLEGRVLSAAGPVPGARIEAGPAHDPLAGVSAISTDVEGRFQVRLPPGTQEANLRVYPPGFSMRIVRLPVNGDRPVQILVDSLGGTLSLEVKENVSSGFSAPALFLIHDGAWMGAAHLQMWSVLNGLESDPHTITAPRVEPGDYTVCRMTRRELPTLRTALNENTDCASGYLSAMGALELYLE